MAACPSMSDLPEHLICRILLAATDHADLLTHVSVCARVCADWRQAVRTSAAYSGGPWVALDWSHALPEVFAADAAGRAERARVLKQISRWLRLATTIGSDWRGHLSFIRANIGDKGAKALGAALQVWPAPLALKDMDLNGNQLTVAGLAPIIAALRRGFAGDGLVRLDVQDNPGLGDAGVTLLAGALPPELRKLNIGNMGCGDQGMVAIAAALPALSHLAELYCDSNTAVGQAGWAALGAALPQMSALTCLQIRDCGAMGDAGAAALAAGLPGAPVLRELYLRQSHINHENVLTLPHGIDDAGARALAAVLPRCAPLRHLELTNHSYGAAGFEALNAAAAQHGIMHIHHPVDLVSSDEDW